MAETDDENVLPIVHFPNPGLSRPENRPRSSPAAFWRLVDAGIARGWNLSG
jgi:hypothetical protein